MPTPFTLTAADGSEADVIADIITTPEGGGVRLSLGMSLGAVRTPASAPASGQNTITTPGDGTYTPTFTGDALVECWGAGGSSQVQTAVGGRSAGGSGGGAYSASVLSFTNGDGVPYHVGAAVASTTGEDTFFVDAATLMAKGGTRSGTNSGGGAGGASASGVGTTKFSGGAGANGGPSDPVAGGGGGGSGGTAANGNAGTAGSSGGAAGAAVTGGGAAGAGGAPTVTGSAGTAPGGGGGGGGSVAGSNSAAGGLGGHGQIRITWPPP